MSMTAIVTKHGRRYFALKGFSTCPECETDLINTLGTYFMSAGMIEGKPASGVYELNCPNCECSWQVNVNE